MTKVHMSNGSLNSWAGDEYSEHLVGQIAVLVEKENAFYSCADYLQDVSMSSDLIDEGWRQRSAEWMFKVIDFYDLDRDIVSPIYNDIVYNIMHYILIYYLAAYTGQCRDGICGSNVHSVIFTPQVG